MNGQGLQPILILPEGTMRTKGKEAQKNNIAAAIVISDTVKTTLGPKGMDKMLVDSLGDVTITNDGATILDEMQIEHPAAKMIAEIAKTQDEAVGDGTTTAVVIAGELLKEAEKLLEQQIHPTVITKGFRLAKNKALEELERLAKPVNIKDEATLRKIANTAITGKSAEKASDIFTNLSVKAVTRVADVSAAGVNIDAENIKIEKKQGGSMADTELIEGVVLDKEVVHSAMPRMIEKAKIALLDSALEVKELEGDAKISIDSPDKMQAFLDQQEASLRNMVKKVIDSGANAVFCQKGIDDIAQHYLSKAGIMAARRVKKSDMDALTRATGAKIVSNVKDLSKDDLGYAGLVQEKKIAGDQMIFVERCKDPKAVTLLLRGGSEHVVDEVERAVEDAVKGVIAALELGKIVPGGGAIEIELSKILRKYADSFRGREQLAISAFATALESIPRSLAENAGLDPIDKIAQLKAEHDKNNTAFGLDVFTGRVQDMFRDGVVEPMKIKQQALKSASEVTEMILRIDDIISGGQKESAPSMPPGGMGGGMGGMY
ncbi:MAG: TCP-1/cpn60 chaperonin family protein [Candidatus Aenigmarchaeota archaeon]|nr:TCP-1/cpn60 chaperonin family protein [Candidatus Aenigmarchaeota archaeon]